jgi:hypothetical protein
MWHPGAFAAAVIGAEDADFTGIEPQRDRAAAPIVDTVDDRDALAARESGRGLAADGVDRIEMRSRSIRIAAKTMPFITKARSVGVAALDSIR